VLGAVLISAPWCACAADDHDRPPPTADAVGPWTLESEGRAICVLDFDKERVSAASFALTVPMACGNALPSNLVAWAPAPGGVRLVGWDDSSLMDFSRLSDGRLVSDRSSGANLQLQRRGPPP
jgi:Protease inhibitor Inh